jgi:hypothetical protein
VRVGRSSWDWPRLISGNPHADKGRNRGFIGFPLEIWDRLKQPPNTVQPTLSIGTGCAAAIPGLTIYLAVLSGIEPSDKWDCPGSAAGFVVRNGAYYLRGLLYENGERKNMNRTHTRIAMVSLGLFAWNARADLGTVSLPVVDSAGPQRDGFGYVSSFDVAGIPSVDPRGSSNNFVMFINIGHGNIVQGTGWDVTLETVAPGSWLSDIAVLVTPVGVPNVGFTFRPGGNTDSPGGPTSFSSNGIIKLSDVAIPDMMAGTGGFIRLEFFETVDDGVNTTDGLWTSGAIFLQTGFEVPAPACVAMLLPILLLHRRELSCAGAGRSRTTCREIASRRAR